MLNNYNLYFWHS